MTNSSRSRHRRVSALIVGLVLTGCSFGTDPTPPKPLTSLPRDLTANEQQLITAGNAFSFALWKTVTANQQGTNVFISPLSASFALGMTLNGAANQTFDEMRTALQVQGLSQDDINASYKSLIALLTSLDGSVTMQVANSIWYRAGFPVNQPFVDATKTFFDAEVQGLNFDDPASLTTVNSWVSQKTNGKIQKVLDNISSGDVMFLINALYFKGSWRDQFDPASTTDDRFTTAAGTTQPVRMMHRHGHMLYVQTAEYQAVDLPYGNGAFSMTVLLPRSSGDVESLAQSLTESAWRSLTSSFDSVEVQLALPKFRLTYARKMNDDLRALGMVIPFVPDAADFTRMSPLGNKLYISFVKQNTFVDVNEEGTEAAAATTVGIGLTSAPPVNVMYVNHPFLFVIRERLSGTVLFMGKVVQIPSA